MPGPARLRGHPGRPAGPVLTYLLAVLAACANAASWVLQRKANREVPQQDNMSWKLIRDLLHKPVWFGGILAITIGFLLQATALGYGGLAVVEPILVLELPLTLILGARVFRTSLGPTEWLPTVAMSAGVAGLLYFLSPTPGAAGGSVQWYVWVAAVGANIGLIALLVAWGRRGPAGQAGHRGPAGHTDGRRGNSAEQAAVLGVAAGSAFGLTAALMKGMTGTYVGGLGHLLSSWQLYAMAAAGVLGMFLTQSALNAGRLIAAQPGLTLTDPIISVLWGVLVFGEQARGGLYVLPEVAALAVIAVAVAMLARSPLLAEHEPAQPMVTASQ